MKLTIDELSDLLRRVKRIDLELESLPEQAISQTERTSTALSLGKERTSLRHHLVTDSIRSK